jgi:hypothetical protein
MDPSFGVLPTIVSNRVPLNMMTFGPATTVTRSLAKVDEFTHVERVVITTVHMIFVQNVGMVMAIGSITTKRTNSLLILSPKNN